MTGSMHENFSRADRVTPGSTRAFGITMTVVLVLLALLNLWQDGSWWPWLLGIAALPAIAAYLCPSAIQPLNRAWLKLGLALHAVVSPVVMGLLFFTVITATAVIMRILGKNLLRLSRPENVQSYWIPRRPPGPAPESMKDQF